MGAASQLSTFMLASHAGGRDTLYICLLDYDTGIVISLPSVSLTLDENTFGMHSVTTLLCLWQDLFAHEVNIRTDIAHNIRPQQNRKSLYVMLEGYPKV